jgi:hypothetical protein
MTAAISENPDQGPIEAATAGLVDWLTATTGAAAVVEPPANDESEGEPALTVWPLALLPERQLHSAVARGPYRFLVRHLVTGPLRVLDAALVAAVRAGEPVINLQPPADETWLALRARPRAALLVDVPAQVGRPTPVAPRVRSPLQVRGAGLSKVGGRVLTPDELPLTGVQVELVSTGVRTYTDTAGRFSFAAAPAEDPVRLRLLAKGHRMVVDVPAADDVVIHCDIQEA